MTSGMVTIGFFKMLRLAALLLLASLAQMPALQAAEGPWLRTDFAEIRLVAATQAVGDLDKIPAAVEFLLQPGWKVYWRSPGDAGLPPRLYEGSADGPPVALGFPVPQRFSLFGLDSYGYASEVLLPLQLAHTKGAPGSWEFWLDALICSDICVPVAGLLRLDLPAGPLRSSAHAQRIAYAAARVPGPGSGPDLQLLSAQLSAESQALLLSYQSGSGQLDEIFVESPLAGYSFAAPQPVSAAASPQVLIQLDGADPAALLGQRLRFTLIDGPQMAEFQAVVSSAGQQAGLRGDWQNIALMLGIAFLGGLILNIMPCVLPVLSLKTASVLSMGGAHPVLVRQRFLASAAGILTSFALLAGGLVLLRSLGVQIGWGIQFQQPVFLAFMAVLVSLFAASLFGLVHFSIPQFAVCLSGPGPTARGNSAGGNSAKENSARDFLAGDFLAGMLATLLATPCSAPFVGTAAGFALAAPAAQLLAVMMAMGVGLAAPWLGFVLLPQLALRLPRPGPWMVRVKQLLGLGLAGTALWLIWLLAGATGWLDREAVRQPGWAAFDRAAITRHLAAGQPVFVDVTADWCITCQANKRLVLDSASVVAALAEKKLQLMRADWTLPDAEIAAFLADYGRFGIPFNILYRPGGAAPVVFSELLTKADILAALDSL
jgi:suppressor for copper-sensitivity B